MSLKSKIKKAVDKAFKAIGDLAVEAILSNYDVGSYNFASGEVETNNFPDITVTVFLENTAKPSDGPFTTKALMKSTIAVDHYDTLTIGSQVYNITDFDDDGFVITLQLVKEKS